jgi:hypothetical protein
VEANPRSFNLHKNRPLQFLEYSIYNNYQVRNKIFKLAEYKCIQLFKFCMGMDDVC